MRERACHIDAHAQSCRQSWQHDTRKHRRGFSHPVGSAWSLRSRENKLICRDHLEHFRFSSNRENALCSCFSTHSGRKTAAHFSWKCSRKHRHFQGGNQNTPV
ncbi:hypothetical protein RTCIAT899_CH18500 [Rhizobium tropici CIAT 899]|nr:hypothetical protein RTCIAT899_CH18500 [Rhizobium tropici CIAT 899]